MKTWYKKITSSRCLRSALLVTALLVGGNATASADDPVYLPPFIVTETPIYNDDFDFGGYTYGGGYGDSVPSYIYQSLPPEEDAASITYSSTHNSTVFVSATWTNWGATLALEPDGYYYTDVNWNDGTAYYKWTGVHWELVGSIWIDSSHIVHYDGTPPPYAYGL